MIGAVIIVGDVVGKSVVNCTSSCGQGRVVDVTVVGAIVKGQRQSPQECSSCDTAAVAGRAVVMEITIITTNQSLG